MELFKVYPLFDIAPIKGEGVYVFDEQGNRYLDLYGGHAVISIGHSHPHYVKKVAGQLENLGFYSNSVVNPLQDELAEKLEKLSGCTDYSLFLCNSGAEANENALKLASFHTGRTRTVYFSGSFHGRTSAAVAVTDNENIRAPFNACHDTVKLNFGDIKALKQEISEGKVASVIVEIIQGVGGLEEASAEFYNAVASLCKKYGTLFIVDEVQSGFGRTGDFFAFQKYGIRPDIISMAKGMGNGFPIGGIMIDKNIVPELGMLGTTFGGNHLACAAGIAVLEILESENLMANTQQQYDFIKNRAEAMPGIRSIKGRGLMLGLEFEFEVSDLRRRLLFDHHIFTGASSNKKLLRILPPLSIKAAEIELFFNALEKELENKIYQK